MTPWGYSVDQGLCNETSPKYNARTGGSGRSTEIFKDQERQTDGRTVRGSHSFLRDWRGWLESEGLPGLIA